MAAAKSKNLLESVLGRLDNLDETNLQILVQRLARERRLLETVFNTIREGILVIDRKGLIDYANASAGRLLGFSLGEVGKANLWKRVPDLARTLDLGRDGGFRELAGITREIDISYPEPRILRLYIVSLESDDEDLDEELQMAEGEDRFAVILTDISEERASAEERIESERVSSIIKLAAGVAHELGNPINSITIHLQLMRRQMEKLPPEMREKLERSLGVCSGEVERLDSIIKHFLEAVRPQPPDFSDLELGRVLEETLEVMEPELAGAGLQVEVSLENRLPVIEGDRNQLKQVFFNVLKNAREATPSGGRIRIRARSDDDFVYVGFGDTGSGISQSDLPRVFDPYYTTKNDGHGLGMMVVQRILRAHGGQIGVDSEKGVGTLVTIQLPQKHRRVRMLEAED